MNTGRQRKAGMRRNPVKNKDGSALLIAIAIMAVLFMLGLALLLVSFSLHATANREQDAAQCKEIAQTLSRELEREITIKAEDAYKAGAVKKYPFWFYLRENIWQEDNKWPAYGETDYLNDRAIRRFQPEQRNYTAEDETASKLLANTYVEVYWTREDKTAQKGEGTNIVVSAVCSVGNSKSTVTRSYVLGIDDSVSEVNSLSNGEFVPKKSIDTAERWQWDEGDELQEEP